MRPLFCSTELMPTKRTATATLRWISSKTETPMCKIYFEVRSLFTNKANSGVAFALFCRFYNYFLSLQEMPLFWKLRRKATWVACKNWPRQRISTAATHRGETPPRCILLVNRLNGMTVQICGNCRPTCWFHWGF